MLQSSRSLARGITYLTATHVEDLSLIDQCFFAIAVQGIPGLDSQRQKIINILYATVSNNWLKTAPLAETFTAVNTLHHHNPHQIGGEQLAILVTRLLHAEQAVGGPYGETAELDIYANAAINSFATWAAGPLPNVSDYIASQKNSGNTTKQFDYYQDLLDTKSPTKQFISQKVATQLKNGSWDNDAVTTAIVLQKLALSQGKTAINSKQYAASNAAIFTIAQQESTTYSSLVQVQMQTMLSKLHRANKHFEITMLATYFAEALGEQAGTAMLQRLGLANLYGWLAYTLYDNILDQESNGQFLSLANISLRQSYMRYLEVDSTHRDLITSLFNRVDEANAWELAHARATATDDTITIPSLPRYGNRMQLAYRSYIHVLGPFLLAADAGLSQKRQQKIQLAWRHYLIARQLNDDLHDWQEDLRTGQLTYVVCTLLRDCLVRPGEQSLATITAQLQQRFITHTVQRLCSVILEHITQAKAAFAETGVNISGTELQKLCNTISESALRTQALQKDSLAFRKHFNAD